MKTKHDWSRADARTNEQIHATALADPDAQPFDAGKACGDEAEKTTHLKKSSVARFGMTQEEFAPRFQIPARHAAGLGAGAAKPDQTARAYLKASAGAAAAVQRAPKWRPHGRADKLAAS